MRLYLPFLLLILCGWKWQTHSNLAEASYRHLPEEVQEKLNLTLVKEGSIAPDKVFKDNRNHHYPPSLKRADEWLQRAKNAYFDQDYNEASYAFGVASHYISDSFVAVHNIRKESSGMHSLFESQAGKYLPRALCNVSDINLNEELWQAAKQGHSDWFIWQVTHNPRIPKQEMEKAQALLYKVIMQTFNASCRKEPVIIAQKQLLKKIREIIAA